VLLWNATGNWPVSAEVTVSSAVPSSAHPIAAVPSASKEIVAMVRAHVREMGMAIVLSMRLSTNAVGDSIHHWPAPTMVQLPVSDSARAVD
jgi:hypothetical protein